MIKQLLFLQFLTLKENICKNEAKTNVFFVLISISFRIKILQSLSKRFLTEYRFQVWEVLLFGIFFITKQLTTQPRAVKLLL